MTNLRQAAQQALEALESSRIFVITREKTKHPEGTEWYDSAITALKAALEQPEQEPVALEAVYETIIQWDEGGGKRSRRELARRIVDIYTTPPAAQPEQRKPLTDERIGKAWAVADGEHNASASDSFLIK